MNSSKVQETIHGQSERFVEELEKYESDFENAVSSFLTSNDKNCLLIETKDSKFGVIRIMHLLKQLKEGQVNEKSSGRYLGAENQTFLNWKQLLDVSGAAKELPTFTNLLVCMFPDSESTKIENIEEEVFSKINDRLNRAVLKKFIFVTSNKGYLDKYFKKVYMKAFLKIDEFENKVTSVIGDGKTALIDKVSSGDVNGVEELLKNGVEVNDTSRKDKLTALHVAAERGHTNIVLTLLRNGADILPNTSRDTPLHTAAKMGHADVVSVLLENDVDVDIRGSHGETALLMAVSNGHRDVVQTLLKNNANVDVLNRSNETSFRVAVEKGYNEIVLELLENKANVNHIDKFKKTVLHYAVKNDNNDVVKTLLKHGAHVNAQDEDGHTPLHDAALVGRIEAINTLVNYGADVNAKDINGYTPLIFAAINNRFETVKVLAKKGANVHVKNKNGNTALDLSLQLGYTEVASLLKTYNIITNSGVPCI